VGSGRRWRAGAQVAGLDPHAVAAGAYRLGLEGQATEAELHLLGAAVAVLVVDEAVVVVVDAVAADLDRNRAAGCGRAVAVVAVDGAVAVVVLAVAADLGRRRAGALRGLGVLARPATQASVVQESPSLQAVTLPQDLQPGTATWPQLPSAWQTSAVQALWSSQSETVVQVTQPVRSSWPQTPSALQESSVQASPSPQSLRRRRRRSPGRSCGHRRRFPQVSVVQAAAVAAVARRRALGSRVEEVVLEVVEVLDVDVLEVTSCCTSWTCWSSWSS
jgi:hypothetical protein